MGREAGVNIHVVNAHANVDHIYDLTGDYGIGYTKEGDEFWFDKEDYEKIKKYIW